jgi:uncharacterized membrane protein YbhN (UPF0104 family)
MKPSQAEAAPAPPPAVDRRRLLRLLRVAGALALLGAVLWYVDPVTLRRTLANIDLRLFAAALALHVASNLVSALRWSRIARNLGLAAPPAPVLLIYARGITASTVLPGALLSGDVLRGLLLSRRGNPIGASAWSVLLDRISGLWILCALSMFAALAIVLSAYLGNARPVVPVPLPALIGYAAALAIPVVLPLLPFWAQGRVRWQAMSLAGQGRAALLASMPYSCAVQMLAASALWLCCLSARLPLPYAFVVAAAAPIFIMASLPLGAAGFGSREAAAVLVLGLAGAPAEQAVAAALLFGASSVLQGIAAAPLFASKRW